MERIFPLNHVEQLARSLNEFIDLGQLDSNLWSGKISDRNEVSLRTFGSGSGVGCQ